MKYDEALKMWGLMKLKNSYHSRKVVEWDAETVSVKFDFNEGYACCGGSDPDCYCSFAESPSSNVVISGSYVDSKSNRTYPASYNIDVEDFDFATVLYEICEAADGSISL